jgi:hypothetical protein
MGGNDPLIDEITQLKIQLRDLLLQHYKTHEVFSWVWWIGIAFAIIPIFIWWRVLDKKRILEICVFGLIVNVTAVFLDVIGSEMVLWEYPIHILPQTALLFPVDFVLVPVVNMVLYQKYPKWGKFLLASAIAAAVLAFIAEPFAIWIGEYKLISWSLFYSFPIYIIIDIFAKFLTERLKSKQIG